MSMGRGVEKLGTNQKLCHHYHLITPLQKLVLNLAPSFLGNIG